LDIFEVEIEPRLGMDRRRAGLTFDLLAQLWLVIVAVATARGVIYFLPGEWEGSFELVATLTLQVVLGVYTVPFLLITRTTGRWLRPFLFVIKLFTWVIWPLRAMLESGASIAAIGQEKADSQQTTQEGIEQLVEAAQEEGIIHDEQAQLIEQVVEFTDKRVRDVMTPRPDVVAVPAGASLDELRRVFVETRFSRIPVYETSLDDPIGIAFARDLLQIQEIDLRSRTARELVRPAMFVPETKLGSALLKEFQQKGQEFAFVVDEYGSLAGIVTSEDLIEEIVGEIGDATSTQAPDIARESDGSLILRGSVALEKVCEIFSVDLDAELREAGATTVAGLLNRLAGHVPTSGESIDYDGLRFEVLEANQRKVLRLRARRRPEVSVVAAQS
jgi:CBS domain containing-hemolysin-like protein